MNVPRTVRYARVITVSLALFGTLVSFQNCGSPKSSVSSDSSSSSGTAGATDTNKVAPVITSVPGNQTLYVGLEGNLSGTKPISVSVVANSGAGEEGQAMTLDCKSSDNRLEINCGGFDKGTAMIDIGPKDGQECFSSTVTMTLTAEDQAENPNAPKLKSAEKKFTINVIDGCYVERKIYAGTQKAQDNFGEFVAVDGNYAVVAAVGDDTLGTDAGALNAYQFTSGQWQFMQKITMDDGVAFEKIGSIAMRGGRLIVGSPLQSSMKGAVYIYELSGGTWVKSGKFTLGALQSSTSQDLFGYAVDISGDWAAVGAYQYTKDSTIFATGSVIIYHRVSGVWQQAQQLFSPSPANFEQFGFSLDLESDRLVVGAPADDSNLDGPGAVHSYRLSGSTWSFENSVATTGLDGISNASKFGFSVALSGNTIVIGAPKANGSATGSGAAYAFTHDGSKWSQPKKITHPEGANGDEFGYDVAINSTQLVVAARLKGSMEKTRSGSVYQYKLDAGKYKAIFRLMARDREARDYFGSSLDLSGSNVLVGSRLDDGKPGDFKDGAGAAYFIELK